MPWSVMVVMVVCTVCSAPITVEFAENNTIGVTVTDIITEPGVSLEIIENPDNAFAINSSSLVASKVLDYEVVISLTRVRLV